MSESLQACKSLIVLDLSKNKLKDFAGFLIGKIISVHSVRRDEMRWAEEIRGDGTFLQFQTLIDVPQSIALQGLCEVSLHNNELDDQCIRDLCQFLPFDAWTKSIGLRGNQIQTEGTELLNTMLDTNESLISLDLRDNPGFNLPLSKEIFDKLVRNIKIFKEGRANNGDCQGDEPNYEDSSNPMNQVYNGYHNDPIQELQYEEEDPEEGAKEDFEDAVADPNTLQLICQKLQSSNLQLQYENTNLEMQVKQLQQQLQMKDEQSSRQEKVNRSENEPEELIPKIEYMMNELARLMDLLEQKGGSDYNNLSKNSNLMNMLNQQSNENSNQKPVSKKKAKNQKNGQNYSR